MEQTHALGRRKAAVARVYLAAGAGNVTINDRPLENFFPQDSLRYIVNQPFAVTETEGKFDVKVNVVGGGTKGQAEAIRLGIARALCEIDKEAYRPTLKAAGFLTRDAREVERKKPGQPGHVAASSSASVKLIAVLLSHRCCLNPSEDSCSTAEKAGDRQGRYPVLEEKRPAEREKQNKKETKQNVTYKFPRTA